MCEAIRDRNISPFVYWKCHSVTFKIITRTHLKLHNYANNKSEIWKLSEISELQNYPKMQNCQNRSYKHFCVFDVSGCYILNNQLNTTKTNFLQEQRLTKLFKAVKQMGIYKKQRLKPHFIFDIPNISFPNYHQNAAESNFLFEYQPRKTFYVV